MYTSLNKTPDKTPDKISYRRIHKYKSISIHNRKYSDTEEECYNMLDLSLVKLAKQNKKIKKQISYLIQDLNREECLDLCTNILKKFPHLQFTSKSYLSTTSPRYNSLFITSQSPLALRLKFFKTNIVLSDDQIHRDILRLKAHIITLTAVIENEHMLELINFVLDEYPRLKLLKQKYFIRRRISNIMTIK